MSDDDVYVITTKGKRFLGMVRAKEAISSVVGKEWSAEHNRDVQWGIESVMQVVNLLIESYTNKAESDGLFSFNELR